MGQGMLTGFVGEGRLFAGPVTKGRTEAMDGDVGAVHALELHSHGHVGERLTALLSGEDELAVAGHQLLHMRQDVESPRGERDAVFVSRLHSCCGDSPDALAKIKFAPDAIQGFVGAGDSQDAELQSQCRK